MKETRSRLQIKTAAAKRLVMWHALAERLGLVLVSEFPKAGGSWLAQMLADASGLPFPRNVSPPLRPCVMHGHHLHRTRFGPVVALVRDGRDVMVSAYHHFLFDNDRNSAFSVARHRRACGFSDYDDTVGNMPAFIDYMFGPYARDRVGFDWAEFARSYVDAESALVLRYEDLLVDPAGELRRALAHCGLDDVAPGRVEDAVRRNSFAALTRRSKGEEDKGSFLRKGVAGDWRNHFSAEACARFAEVGGAELRLLGYESDDSWVASRSSAVRDAAVA